MKTQDDLMKNSEIGSESTRAKSRHYETENPTESGIEESPRAADISFKAMYEQTPVMMHSLGADYQIISVNCNWLEVLGYDESEVIGHKSSEFLTEESRRYAIEVALPDFIKTGSARDVTYQMVKKKGDVIDVLLSAVAETDAEGQFFRSHCFILEVDKLRTSEELWRQMSLVEERNRMSRDLHDTVEHSLIGIMLRADTVKELMDSDPSVARSELESTHALARLGLEQTRRAVWNLEPLSIISIPLRDVVSRSLARLDDEGIKSSLEVDGNETQRIDGRNRLAMIRIIQEALSNVKVHSLAEVVKVQITYTRTHLMLLITDDGVGFDPAETHSALMPTNRGIGLANMRESARLAGGSFEVRSSPGSGTQLEACIPFEHEFDQDTVLSEMATQEGLAPLTNRESEVLKILANGGRNKDVAAAMFVSLHTVKFHIKNLYRKLDVRTRAELIRIATKRGLLAS